MPKLKTRKAAAKDSEPPAVVNRASQSVQKSPLEHKTSDKKACQKWQL